MDSHNDEQERGITMKSSSIALLHKSKCTWCGYKITGLMLEPFLFKKLHNRNVVTLTVLPSPIPTLLHVNLPLLEAMLQVV